MKIITANNKKKLVLTKKEWEAIGRKAQWNISTEDITEKYSKENILKAIKALGEESIAGYSNVSADEVKDVLDMASISERGEILEYLNNSSNQINQPKYCDPEKEEMLAFLRGQFGSEDGFEDDAEVAIYWFANDWHSGMSSNLYSILSTSPYSPGPFTTKESEGDMVGMMYEALEDHYCASEKNT